MTILYTIGCPSCLVLEKKLLDKKIKIDTIIKDEQIMLEKGITSLPMLEVNGNLMTFLEAVRWVNGQ